MSYFNNLGMGGSGGTPIVSSVNGKIGEVVLTANDVNAIKNILNSCSGMQVGTLADRPNVAESNLLYVVTDKVPNEFYRYDTTESLWEQVGSSSNEGGSDIVWETF